MIAGRRLRARFANWPSMSLHVVGLFALLWFLVRVLPKPSRAAYPCQRTGLPLAGGFLGYAAAGIVSSFARFGWKPLTGLLVAVSLAFFPLVGRSSPATTHAPNDPIGVAKGIHPGRVVWVHDPDATEWNGPGDGHWWETEHTVQAVVDAMMSTAIRRLTGETNDTGAWDALFRHFNQTHGKGDVGYAPGERIVIKVNFVGCHHMWGGVDPTSYDLVSQIDYMNTSPQMIRALLRQLVYEAGVDPEDISVGDPSALFPNQYYDVCHADFPEVHYLDHQGGNVGHPRTAVQFSSIPFFWSSHPAGVAEDYVPVSYAEAEYFIDLANLKSHSGAGVTLGAKNHFGSLIRNPDASGYYDMHTSLAGREPEEGRYRSLVDLLGHAHTGGKAILYVVDGLYSGVHPEDDAPRRWDAPPFNGDWTSSLFVSQDPLSLDSVCFDLLQEEGDPREYPQMPGADDYLHEAALAHDPPSGTFYDPDHEGDVQRLASLGVHEHWNNPTDMEYTRNLGTGAGIELVQVGSMTGVLGGIGRTLAALENSPNPFNPETRVYAFLPERSMVDVAIFDVQGRRVRSLLAGESLPAGRHRFVWDGRDDRGAPAPSGTYFCRLVSGTYSASRKITLLR